MVSNLNISGYAIMLHGLFYLFIFLVIFYILSLYYLIRMFIQMGHLLKMLFCVGFGFWSRNCVLILSIIQ